MAATEEMLSIALKLGLDMVTLVPNDARKSPQRGADVVSQLETMTSSVHRLQDAGIPVSLFETPRAPAAGLSTKCARWVKLHTGAYAKPLVGTAAGTGQADRGFRMARQLGLRVNSGHGLTYQNVEPVAAIEGMEELNIGHSIVARALAVGLQQAVREMKALVQNPRLDPLFGQVPG